MAGAALALALLGSAGYGAAATLEDRVLAALNQLRAIRPDQGPAIVATYNKSMDAAWRLFAENKPQSLPVLRRALSAELASAQPNDLLLLDVGLFLFRNDDAAGKAIARTAAFKLNSHATIVERNLNELFELVHLVAEERDARVLPLIDRAFLSSEASVEVPEHAMTLKGTLICVFLYGAYGADAERYLAARLPDRAVADRVLEILGWLGSPASIADVTTAQAASPTYDTFTRVTSYMMQSAGPAGRSFMLALDPKPLDDKSGHYLTQVRGEIERASYGPLRAALVQGPGDKQLPDAEVLLRLDAMIAREGADERTNPAAILDSGLSSGILLSKLAEVRRRTLFRVSDEALSDLEITNALINALRYRTQ